MKFPIRFTGRYRTDLTKDEVLARIHGLLNSESRLLFFNVYRYYGDVSENEFTIFRQRFDWWGMMSCRVKGTISNENGTVVQTRLTIPWAIVVVFVFITVTSLPVFLTADEITINGEARPADFSWRVIMFLLGFILPACMMCAIAILPAKFTERKLRKILNLEEFGVLLNKS
jgi:hypothetical protein